MLNRRGLTLVELIVALVLASVVLGLATTSSLRQQRLHSSIHAVAVADDQLRAAVRLVASQLAMLDATAGDLLPGLGMDTALQFRAPVAHALSCVTGIGAVTLRADAAGEVALGGEASLPRASDTLWWLGDSTWVGRRIAAVTQATVACVAPVATTSRTTLRLTLGTVDTVPAGAPLRITRQTRYGLYRASDGTWQLGFREWNDPSNQFAAPQPVAGPLLLRVGARHSGFRYFDSAGSELASSPGPVDVTRAVRVRITAFSLVTSPAPGQDSVRTDSIDIGLRHAGYP